MQGRICGPYLFVQELKAVAGK